MERKDGEICPYCGAPLEAESGPPKLDFEGQLLWRHPMMECPQLGTMLFTVRKPSE